MMSLLWIKAATANVNCAAARHVTLQYLYCRQSETLSNFSRTPRLPSFAYAVRERGATIVQSHR